MVTDGNVTDLNDYELLGLMHGEMAALGQGGYTTLRSLCEIGVRLDDVLDPVVREYIPISPEKSKVLYQMVDTLGVDACRALCRQANLYHLTISQEHPVPYSIIESLLLRRGFVLIDFSSMSFLEFRERTKGEGSSNLYRNILGAIEELRLFDGDRTTSGDDEKMMLKVVPYPGDEHPDVFFPLDSVLPWHDPDGVLRSHLDGGNHLGHTSLDDVLTIVRRLPNERILENHLYARTFRTFQLNRTLFREVFASADRVHRYLDLLHERGTEEVTSKTFVDMLGTKERSRFLCLRNAYVCPSTHEVRHYDLENILMTMTEGLHLPLEEDVVMRDAKRMSSSVNPHGHIEMLDITKSRMKEVARKSRELIHTGGYVRRLKVPYETTSFSLLLRDKVHDVVGIFTPRILYERLSPEIRNLDVISPAELRHILARKHRESGVRVLSQDEIAVNVSSRRDFILNQVMRYSDFIPLHALAEEIAPSSGHPGTHWERHVRFVLKDEEEYVEVEPDTYLHESRLFDSGISRSELMKFVPWLLERLPEEEFISSAMAARLGRGHPVYDFGFDSTFFEDLMHRSPLLRILNLPGGTVYYRNLSRVRHSVEDFLSSHIKDGEEIDDYLRRLEEGYGFRPVEDQILRVLRKTDVYVSEELGRLFSDKESFLGYVYGR